MPCPNCGAELASGALSCPTCLRLTHASALEDLATQAQAEWHRGQFAKERDLWQQSLALLPSNTVQYAKIQARLMELDQQQTGPHQTPRWDGWRKASAGIGPALLLLVAKGKVLLLGLTKIGTLFSMLASFGVYWALYGWALAAGLIFSIYIHEMGHVIVLRRYGFPASAPMFIPGFGAFIQLRGCRVPPVPDSRIGLAGPIYGLGTALVALGLYYATGAKVWGAIAHLGAMINMFNLIPIWSLDGSRGMHSLTRTQRGIVLVAAAALWMITGNRLLLLIAAVCTYRMFTRDWQTEGDNRGLATFVGLLTALALLAWAAPTGTQ